MGDAVPYAIGNGLRCEILSILNEGPHNEKELARLTGVSQSKIHHHLAELRKSSSVADADGARFEHRYRAVGKPECTVEDYEDLSEEDGERIMGGTLQNAVAEHLAAFRGGRMRGVDPNVVMNWNWIDVDETGSAELTAELVGLWERVKTIEARSRDRRQGSKEPVRTIVVSTIAHPRVRPSPEEQALTASSG